MSVHSRSGGVAVRSCRAILVPARDQVSSPDTPGAAGSLSQPKGTPLDILKLNCRGLTRRQRAEDYM